MSKSVLYGRMLDELRRLQSTYGRQIPYPTHDQNIVLCPACLGVTCTADCPLANLITEAEAASDE